MDYIPHSDVFSCPPGAWSVKVTSAPSRRIPACLGTIRAASGHLAHLFADGTQLPVIAGGSMAAVEVEKPSLLTVPEFAAEIRVAPSTAWAMVKSGEIESIVVGQKSRRIPRQALDEYIAARRAEAKAS